MTWNYRVVKKSCDNLVGGIDTIFNIHECFYDDNGKPEAITEDPVYPQGETLKELKDDIKFYLQALERPVLNYEDF